MAIKKMQLRTFTRLMEAGDAATQDLSGPSPGGAAAELGISRQAVHAAIRRGTLDALAVYDGMQLSHYTISQSSIQRYRSRLRVIAAAQDKAAVKQR